MYDRLLGGSHNFRPDRDRADDVSSVYPKAAAWAMADRAFLRHAVERALDAGVDQFLDLGSGIPTVGAAHEVAHARLPEARVAYVDREPVAVARTREMLTGVGNASVTQADLRDPDTVLAASGAGGLLDTGRPVALITAAVLHFVPDADDPAAILARYRAALAPGSLLALTHTSSDLPDDPELAAAHRRALELYATTNDPLYGRTRAEIREIVETAGFVVNTDGLIEIGRWATTPHQGEALGATR